MKKTPLISDGKTPLVWREYPHGGQYAGYKLGTIVRYRGKYMIIITYKRIAINCKSLQDAKARIDKYTEEKNKQDGLEVKRTKKKNHQIKKR
jgi:hypothetical protein